MYLKNLTKSPVIQGVKQSKTYIWLDIDCWLAIILSLNLAFPSKQSQFRTLQLESKLQNYCKAALLITDFINDIPGVFLNFFS